MPIAGSHPPGCAPVRRGIFTPRAWLLDEVAPTSYVSPTAGAVSLSPTSGRYCTRARCHHGFVAVHAQAFGGSRNLIEKGQQGCAPFATMWFPSQAITVFFCGKHVELFGFETVSKSWGSRHMFCPTNGSVGGRSACVAAFCRMRLSGNSSKKGRVFPLYCSTLEHRSSSHTI